MEIDVWMWIDDGTNVEVDDELIAQNQKDVFQLVSIYINITTYATNYIFIIDKQIGLHRNGNLWTLISKFT